MIYSTGAVSGDWYGLFSFAAPGCVLLPQMRHPLAHKRYARFFILIFHFFLKVLYF